MLEIFLIMLMLSLISATFKLYLEASGLLHLLEQMARKRWHFKLLSCSFCMSFWINAVFGMIFAIFTGEPEYVLTPIIAAPITRILT